MYYIINSVFTFNTANLDHVYYSSAMYCTYTNNRNCLSCIYLFISTKMLNNYWFGIFETSKMYYIINSVFRFKTVYLDHGYYCSAINCTYTNNKNSLSCIYLFILTKMLYNYWFGIFEASKMYYIINFRLLIKFLGWIQ